jgi:hypothetical protein
MTHGGVEKDSACIKFCQELGRSGGQRRRKSEEVIVVLKRGNSREAKGLYIGEAT